MKTLIRLSASPAVLFYTLPILMVYLTLGTIAQKYIGLYQATKIFFSNPVFWLGPLPLPGLTVFLAIIFVNLLAKLILKSPWRRERAGVIITHIGAALLLAGGLLTAVFSSEGYIDLAPGQVRDRVADYHQRELVLIDEEGDTVYHIDHNKIHKDQIIKPSHLPFALTILQTCRNCAIEAQDAATDRHHGMTKHMKLTPAPLKKENEENMGGVVFKVSGLDETQDGIYLSLEGVPKHAELKYNNKTYRIALRRTERSLPFSIKLLSFQKDTHPGTQMARGYQSRVLITDGSSKWESLIRMNEPLRYKGYTFYQSSFIRTPAGDVSVLSAVWNAGRSFPYISGILMCLGLVVHLFVRRPKARKTGNKEPADV